MTEVELFGRTFRTPIPPPPGYLLAPLCAAVIVVGAFIRPDLRRQVEEIVRGSESRLAGILEETDRRDAGWRVDAILASGGQVPDAENSAARIMAASERLPYEWHVLRPTQVPLILEQTEKNLENRDVTLPLDESTLSSLGATLDELAPALGEARGLAEMPQGRFRFEHIGDLYRPRAIDREVRAARQISRLLGLDAVLRAEQGDIDGALVSCLALLNAGRAVGEAPIVNLQFVRLLDQQLALDVIERALARGEATQSRLGQVEEALSVEASAPILRTILRGRRAVEADSLGKLMAGRSLSDMAPDLERQIQGSALEVLDNRDYYAYNLCLDLEFLNEAVAIAEGPITGRMRAWDAWNLRAKLPTVDLAGRTAALLFEATRENVEVAKNVSLLNETLLQVGRVAVACERFRMVHGSWPDSAEAVVPEFLPQLPQVSFHEAPLRLRRVDGGLVVYSLGLDGEDHGGRIGHRTRFDPRTDLGYRLLDPDRRAHRKVEPRTHETP